MSSSQPHHEAYSVSTVAARAGAPHPFRAGGARRHAAASTLTVLQRGRWIAVLALVTAVIGRALAPALPGSAAGIGPAIQYLDAAAALLTQATVIWGTTTAILLLFATLWTPPFSFPHRMIAMPAGAGVVTLVFLSVGSRLGPVESLALAAACIALGGSATIATVGPHRTRAAGLVLGAVTGASALYVGSKALALSASQHAQVSLFTAARTVATGGFLLDVLSLTIAAAWLGGPRLRRAAIVLLPLSLIAGVIAWGAAQGSKDGAALWAVIASRSLLEVTSHPLPFAAAEVRYFVETAALLIAAAVVSTGKGGMVTGASIALALLARGSLDVPVCALLFALATLLAPFEASLATPDPRTPAHPRASGAA